MITMLQGEIAALSLDRASLWVGGMAVEFWATAQTLATLRVGEPARVYTHLVVREDSLTLYAFATPSEQQAFATLLGVKGIGPKLALAALSVHSPEQLRLAVANRDYGALQRIPGVGRKSAERLVIEIGDKLGLVPLGAGAGAATVPDQGEVIAALVGLGWPEKSAAEAVSAVSGEATDTAGSLRLALQYLGGSRG